MFDDGLDYDEVTTLNISKDDLVALFVNQKPVYKSTTKNPNYQIKWCTNDAICANFWDC